jgi:hypothetical protein
VYVSPGLIGGCVMNGTPSWSTGTTTPWKWTTVDSASSFFTTTRTRFALGDADLRARHLAVVRDRLHPGAGLGLPLGLGHGEVEHLDRAVHPRRHDLVPLALGLGRERLDPRLVHRVHLVGRGARVGRRRGVGGGGAAAVVAVGHRRARLGGARGVRGDGAGGGRRAVARGER